MNKNDVLVLRWFFLIAQFSIALCSQVLVFPGHITRNRFFEASYSLHALVIGSRVGCYFSLADLGGAHPACTPPLRDPILSF